MLDRLQNFLNRASNESNERIAAASTPTPVNSNFTETRTGFPYKVINKGSKIGIHSMRPSSMLANIRALRDRGGRVPVVKAVDDMDWLIDVKAIDPNIITLARFTFRRNDIGEGLNGIHNVTDGDFSLYVDTMFEPLLEKLAANPALRQAVDYWEICNEPDPPGIVGYRNLSLCMMDAMDRANSMGLKLGLFAVNAGTPEWYEMEAMVDTGVFVKAQAGGHIMTLHEGVFKDPIKGWIHPVDQWYGDPIPRTEDKKQWTQLRPNGPFFIDFDPDAGIERPDFWDQGIAGPLCFRYRYLYELLKQRNQVIPLVISEIVYGEGYSSAPEFLRRASWYDQKASEDYYVWAHLPFTYGGRGAGWDNQDYDFSISSVVDYGAAQLNRFNAAAPTVTTPPPSSTPVTPTVPPPGPSTPTPTPIPINRPFKIFMPVLAAASDGTPTVTPSPTPTAKPPLPPVDRDILVNLIPKNATLREREFVLAQTDAKRETVMQSAIDARDIVSSGLAGSVVKAWAPERWSTSIVEFNSQMGVRTEQHVIPSQDVDWTISPWEDPRPIIVNLLPQDATFAEKSEVAGKVHDNREAMAQAENDAVDLVKIGPPGSKLVIWSPDRWPGDIITWLNGKGIVYEVRTFGARRSSRVRIE